MRLTAAVLAAGLLLLGQPALAGDQQADDLCGRTCGSDETTVTAGGTDFDVHQQRHPSDPVPGRGDVKDDYRDGKTTWTHVEEYVTPMCSMNGLHGADAMCMAAATYCQDGRVGFWIWHQVTTYTRDTDGTVTTDVGPWKQEYGAFCLGADDPGVPTIGKVVSWVQDNLSNVGIVPATVIAAPAPRTLVNLETRLSAGSADVVDIPASTPWAQVVIHAKPLHWRWTYGDGTRSPLLSTPDTTHVYREARLHKGVMVEVEWGGTFSVAGDPTPYPIVGTAVVPSAPIMLDVREARAQLVSH